MTSHTCVRAAHCLKTRELPWEGNNLVWELPIGRWASSTGQGPPSQCVKISNEKTIKVRLVTSDFKLHSWKRNLEALLSIVYDIVYNTAYNMPSTFRAKPACCVVWKKEGLRLTASNYFWLGLCCLRSMHPASSISGVWREVGKIIERSLFPSVQCRCMYYCMAQSVSATFPMYYYFRASETLEWQLLSKYNHQNTLWGLSSTA